jgi:cobalt-zinc-cadmium efflux system outer membrane protein
VLRFITSYSVYLALGLTPLVGARGQEIRRLDLDEALRTFADRNLELRLTRAMTAGAAAAARQGTTFPNPVANVTHENLGNSGLRYAETYFIVSQEIDWPGRYSARRGSARFTAAALSATLARDSARIAFEVQRTFVEAAASELRVESLREVLEAFRQAERAATARFEEGDLSGYDLRRLRVELARYETTFAMQDLEMRRARRSLTVLVFGDSVTTLAAPRVPLGRVPNVSTENLVQHAVARRPETAATAARVNVAEEDVSVARASRLPNLTVSGGYKTQTDGFGGLFLGGSLPVPLFNQNAQGVAAGEARVAAARDDQRIAHQLIVNDVGNAVETYEAAMANASLIVGQLLLGQQDLLPIARASYSEGEMSLLELLDAAAAHWDAVRSVIDVNARAWVSYYSLDRAVGGLATAEGGP